MSRPTDLSAGELENLKKENLHPPTLKRQEGITLSQMRCWRLLDELQQWIEQLPQNHEGNKENYSAFFYNEIQTLKSTVDKLKTRDRLDIEQNFKFVIREFTPILNQVKRRQLKLAWTFCQNKVDSNLIGHILEMSGNIFLLHVENLEKWLEEHLQVAEEQSRIRPLPQFQEYQPAPLSLKIVKEGVKALKKQMDDFEQRQYQRQAEEEEEEKKEDVPSRPFISFAPDFEFQG